MPAARALAAVLACALCAALAGCDLFSSFETLCEKRLPPTRVAVTTAPVEYAIDRSLSYASLTRRGAAVAIDGKTVLGLTEATLSYSVHASGRGMSSRTSGHYCMRPAVEVALAFTPMTVYMGSDVREGSCVDRLTWDHELKHVSVYQTYLPEFAERVNAQLRERLGSRVHYFRSAEDGQKHVDSLMQDVLQPLVQSGMVEVKERQRRVDSPAEYARIDAIRSACAG